MQPNIDAGIDEKSRKLNAIAANHLRCFYVILCAKLAEDEERTALNVYKELFGLFEALWHIPEHEERVAFKNCMFSSMEDVQILSNLDKPS